MQRCETSAVESTLVLTALLSEGFNAVAVQVEKLEDPALPVAEIVARCPAQQLMAQYRVPAFADAEEFLQVRLQLLLSCLRPSITQALFALQFSSLECSPSSCASLAYDFPTEHVLVSCSPPASCRGRL